MTIVEVYRNGVFMFTRRFQTNGQARTYVARCTSWHNGYLVDPNVRYLVLDLI